jgi:hypothetical protein
LALNPRSEAPVLAQLRTHLTYANVAATVALFLALTGGIAWALERNTVRSKHIVNGQVRSADVADDGSGFELKGEDIDQSSLGLVANSTYRLGQGQERAGSELTDGSKVLTQSCLAGDRLLSGGPASVNAASDLLDHFPEGTNTWQARINDSAVSGGDSFTVVVLCADQ